MADLVTPVRRILFGVKYGFLSVDDATKRLVRLLELDAAASPARVTTWRDTCRSCGLPEILPEVRRCQRCGQER